LGIGSIVDGILRQAEKTTGDVNSALFETVLRLGVTGLSRSGKTVFITSLVANLLDRGRMIRLEAAAEGRIQSVFLQPQPDDLIPRFEYETHLAKMTGPEPVWPTSTRSISQLRLSFRVQPSGVMSAVRGPRTVHLDIVDYPGEWLLDLPLMSQSFAKFSEQAIALAKTGARSDLSAEWLDMLYKLDPGAPVNEEQANALAAAFGYYLRACQEAGLSACAPGRFLMPGDLHGSPALTFCPLPVLPKGTRPLKASYARAFERRFEAYKSKVVKPFFTDHFSRIDRQIVLVDALGALHSGPAAIADLRDAMSDVLSCFRPGRNSWLSKITGRRVERILFAATKADYLHHSQHNALTAILQALLRDAKDRAEFSGAKTATLALASLRTTTEASIPHDGADLDCVRGQLQDSGKMAAMYAGELPGDPHQVLAEANVDAKGWLDDDYAIMAFRPAKNVLKPGMGPPHIRLDRAAEFLIGDKL
jgi:predicted YcjX-like family ATPase